MRHPPGLRQELLPLPICGAHLLCGVCVDGSVCVGECGGGRPHETPGGESQAGMWAHLHLFIFLFIIVPHLCPLCAEQEEVAGDLRVDCCKV